LRGDIKRPRVLSSFGLLLRFPILRMFFWLDPRQMCSAHPIAIGLSGTCAKAPKKSRRRNGSSPHWIFRERCEAVASVVSMLILCSFFLDASTSLSTSKKRTKKIKPRRPEIFREARAPFDFLESRQKVASTFARDCYGNHPMAIGFTPELLRAAAGLRAGQNKEPQLIY
jgi:hypothetical protein